MSELSNFLGKMDEFEAETEEQANVFKRAIALQILSGVVLKTPVDTGRARGNWQVSINEPNAGALADTDPNGQITIGEGLQEIAEVDPGEDIWVHNNLAYVRVLEEGSSAQAPTGMLKVTLSEVGSQF